MRMAKFVRISGGQLTKYPICTPLAHLQSGFDLSQKHSKGRQVKNVLMMAAMNHATVTTPIAVHHKVNFLMVKIRR